MIKTDQHNYRKHSDKNKRIINKSLKKLGAGRSILIDSEDEIIAGNGVFEQAGKLGIPVKVIETDGKELIAVKRTDLKTGDKQRKELALIDNHASDTSEFDMELVTGDFVTDDLKDWEFELSEEAKEVTEDDYEIPDEIQTDIVPGDIFQIGQHRLMCCDSMDSDAVTKLMNGEKANVVFTDPPYDMESTDYAETVFLFTENAHVFIMHDDCGIVSYLRRSKLEFKRFFVANFQFSSPRGNDPYLQHILISHEINGKAIKHKNMHDGFSSIIKLEYRFRNKEENYGHKHQKPINFISKFIEHYSNSGNLCLDLFGGSGSTMAACEQLDRVCYMSELEPKNCQIIIDRMEKCYKLKANKIINP